LLRNCKLKVKHHLITSSFGSSSFIETITKLLKFRMPWVDILAH